MREYATIGSDRDYAVAEKVVEQTAIESAHATLDIARELAMKAEALADRLCGSMPTQGEPANAKLGPSGILPGLREHADAVTRRLSDGFDALNRIERSL